MVPVIVPEEPGLTARSLFEKNSTISQLGVYTWRGAISKRDLLSTWRRDFGRFWHPKMNY